MNSSRFSVRPGQTVGIFSPSSSIIRDRFEAGLNILHQRGFKTIIHPSTYSGADTGNQQSATAKEKADALMELWSNPQVDALMVATGGNMASQFLHLIDFESLQKTPKPLIGFSDTTALLSAIYTKSGPSGFFAPTVQTLTRAENLDAVFNVLSGQENTKIDMPDATCLKTGETKPSPIFAGTVSVLLSLAGTPYFPHLAGHILVIEDIGEEASRLDRALWQLYQIIPFPLLSGLVFGEFVGPTDTGRPFGLDLDGIIDKYTAHLDIPVIKNAPIGHGKSLIPIPIGRKTVLDATNRSLIFT